MTYLFTDALKFDKVNVDAFGRLRVSQPFTLFDSAVNGVARDDFSNAATGGGTVSFDFNANTRLLSVTAANGDQVIQESKYVFPYQPGKSLLIMNSFCMGPNKPNLRQRVGFFGASNGVYLERLGSTVSVVRRSSSSGSLVNTVISQSSWNGDKLDGQGPSGITLDLSATQIFWQDVEWLGVGSVRCGFIIDGQFIICHTFHHANNPVFTTTYMGTATLPIRYEITNVGATSGSSTLTQICSTVISEGGVQPAYFTYSAGTGTTARSLTTAGTYYPIASIRLQSGYLNSIVKPKQIDIVGLSNANLRWVLLLNPTLTGATWASSRSTTRTQVDVAATAVSGGLEVLSGYISGKESTNLTDSFYGQLGRTLAGVSDIFTLAVAPTANNNDTLAQLGWQEVV